MEDDVFYKVIEECKEINTLAFIAPQVIGEPTLDSKLYERLLHIKKELPNVYTHLVTNGTKLTKEIASIADYVEISLNYATKDMYEKETGLIFENVVDKINSLYEFKDKMFIHHTPSKHTIGHSEMIGKMFEGIKLNVAPQVTTWRGKLPDININTFGNRIPCSLLHTQLTILWDGRVVSCTNDYDGVTSSLIGDVKSKTLPELFNSDYLESLRKSDYTGTFCESCNYNYEVYA
jgi:radical SAM protein with 4Fe4S-binding SPASM domain